MGKELSKRGIDKDTLKNVGRVLLFLAIVTLHAYLSREASWLSWVTPIPCALLFTAVTYGLQDLAKPWKRIAIDEEGGSVTQVNGSRWILLGMIIALYAIGFIDRG
jgi:hypothetical protein